MRKFPTARLRWTVRAPLMVKLLFRMGRAIPKLITLFAGRLKLIEMLLSRAAMALPSSMAERSDMFPLASWAVPLPGLASWVSAVVLTANTAGAVRGAVPLRWTTPKHVDLTPRRSPLIHWSCEHAHK